jgi:hypothetical protein
VTLVLEDVPLVCVPLSGQATALSELQAMGEHRCFRLHNWARKAEEVEGGARTRQQIEQVRLIFFFLLSP